MAGSQAHHAKYLQNLAIHLLSTISSGRQLLGRKPRQSQGPVYFFLECNFLTLHKRLIYVQTVNPRVM